MPVPNAIEYRVEWGSSMNFTEKISEKARRLSKSLVLPESTEPRILKAAKIIVEKKIAGEILLVGEPEKVKQAAERAGVNLYGMKIVQPEKSPNFDGYAERYHHLRAHKGMSLDEAREKIVHPLYWAMMMVEQGDVDAIVAGSENATGKVLIAGFTIIRTAPGVKSASSCLVMDFPDRKWGHDGLMIFSDCATIPNPNPEQLAEITLASAKSCRTYLDVDPVIAMLSFSTKGSAAHPLVDKVLQALRIVREREPDLAVDGEMQVDAAIDMATARQKAPSSKVAGRANTFIFPDLQAGNIGYKIAQRFAGAGAYGPFLQGFAKPVSDLSRGASVNDIVNTCAATLVK